MVDVQVRPGAVGLRGGVEVVVVEMMHALDAGWNFIDLTDFLW